MIDPIRNSTALMVVRPTSDTGIANNLAGHHPSSDDAATLTFIGKMDPEPSHSLEKGSLVDYYA
jgi:hypothetical protein